MKLYLPLYKSDFKSNSIVIDNKRKLFFKLKDIDKSANYYSIIDVPESAIDTKNCKLYYKKLVKIKDLDIKVLNDKLIYKPIPGYSRYLASENGEILTLKTGNKTKGATAGHYLKVNVKKDNALEGKMEYVHNLVCMAFHGEKKNKKDVVLHKDSNKMNNKKDNLKWGTQSDNIKEVYRLRNSTEDNSKGELMKNINVLKDIEFINTKELDIRTDATINISNENFLNHPFYIAVGSLLYAALRPLVVAFDKIGNMLLDIKLNFKMSEVRDLKRIHSNSTKYTKYIKFIDVSELSVPVTLGLTTDYITLANFLKDNGNVISKALPMLNNTNNILAATLSDPNFSKSLAPRAKIVEKEIDKLNTLKKDFGYIIDPESISDRKQIKEVIGNLSQVHEVTTVMLDSLKYYDAKYLSDIDSKIKEITDKLDMLIDMINNKEIKFSSESLTYLTKQVGYAGDYVTVVSQLYYLYVQQINMLISLEKVLFTKK